MGDRSILELRRLHPEHLPGSEPRVVVHAPYVSAPQGQQCNNRCSRSTRLRFSDGGHTSGPRHHPEPYRASSAVFNRGSRRPMSESRTIVVTITGVPVLGGSAGQYPRLEGYRPGELFSRTLNGHPPCLRRVAAPPRCKLRSTVAGESPPPADGRLRAWTLTRRKGPVVMGKEPAAQRYEREYPNPL